MKKRIQRYKLEAEFLLRDRGDYEHVRKHLHDLLRNFALPGVGMQFDHASLEKVIDDEQY